MPLLTPEDLERMPGGERFELVDGRPEERDVGWLAEWVRTRLSARLFAHCEAHDLGFVNGGEAQYACFPGRPRLVRKPDVSFVRAGRLAVDDLPTGICRVAPDLAVEVISPNDTADEIEERVDDYLGAGVRLVWVVFPRPGTAHLFRADGTGARLRGGDELDGEGVVPGFRCSLTRICPSRPAPSPAPAPAGPEMPPAAE
jgi:Uma2 family endonuclease